MANRDTLWVMPDGTTKTVTVDEEGNLVEPAVEETPEEPFGGKGDHDGNGKVGGAKGKKKA